MNRAILSSAGASVWSGRMGALAILGALAAGFLFWARRGCRHDVRSAPIGDEQLCLDCGSRRRFVLGEQPGLWRK
jgi:hypothetical protein